MENDQTKKCVLCKGALTEFGSKQIADGCICRDCAAGLSEWLTDEDLLERKVSRIKRHLKYRADNLERLGLFTVAQTVSGKYSMYVDESIKSFIFSKKKDYVKSNADIVKLSSVKSVKAYKLPCPDSSGVDIFMKIALKSRQFSGIVFRVNEFPGIEENTQAYTDAKNTAEKYIELFIQEGISERKVERDYGE